MRRKVPSSNVEWKRWGEVDPFFGVAAWDGRDRKGVNPWNPEDFYALGESDFEDFLSRWKRYGVNAGRCLEVGCGTGRLTRPLARFFRSVEAVDVSEGMLLNARNHVLASNVTFHLTDGTTFPLADGTVDAVFSAHVFQHFDSLSNAEVNFSEIRRVLCAGGSVMLHLPIHCWPGMEPLFGAIHRAKSKVGDIRATFQRQLLKTGTGYPSMRGLTYPLEYLFRILPEYGFVDVEVMVFPVKSNSQPHSFVLAHLEGSSQ